MVSFISPPFSPKNPVPEKWCREWRPFKNSARADGLELGHWVKANTDPDAGPFIFSPPVITLTLKRHQNTHLQGTMSSSPIAHIHRKSTLNSWKVQGLTILQLHTHTHIIGRPRMDQGRDGLSFQSHSRI